MANGHYMHQFLGRWSKKIVTRICVCTYTFGGDFELDSRHNFWTSNLKTDEKNSGGLQSDPKDPSPEINIHGVGMHRVTG